MKRLLPFLLLVTACATAGPDYTGPHSATAARPAATDAFASAGKPLFAQSPLPDRWWRLYGDARLDGYVTEGLAANTDLRAADANLRRADEIVREISAQRLVSSDVGAGTAIGRAPPPSGGGGSLPGAASYSIGISLAYPLDLVGKIKRAIEASQADAEAVAAARDEARVTVAAEIARSYAAACSANLTLDASNRVLALQRRTLDVTQRLQRGGRGTAFDVTRARAAADLSEATIPATIAVRTAALYRLAALMGRPPADYPREAEGCRTPPRLARPLPVGDGAALIRRRPDIRAAERSLAAASARIGVAVADLYPQISLGGSAGFAGLVSGASPGSDFNISLGPLISWRFPNRRIARSGIAQAEFASDAALAGFDGRVLEGLRQAETALAAYAGENDRNAALARARTDAATAAEQAGTLYRFGRTDFLSVLTAQAALANAEANLAASDALRIDRQVDVFKALGGGWQS